MGMKSSKLVTIAVVGCVCIASGNAARAQIPPGDITIELEPVASGLIAPVGVTHAGDGSGRLFIWEQTGQIRIVSNGQLLATPFLDISDKLPELGVFFDERGLLGLAFHPNYRSNGRFFVRYSAPREGDPDEPCNDPDGFIVGCHEEILAEYRVVGNPMISNVADPDSQIILFRVDEPQFNHDAGTVAFGPDGLLYFSLGDGGGAHDGLADDPPSHGPIGHGQNIETPLGAMLRIDVDAPITICHIPPGNLGNPRTITIARSALPAHLAHGDTIGPCGGEGEGLAVGGLVGGHRRAPVGRRCRMAFRRTTRSSALMAWMRSTHTDCATPTSSPSTTVRGETVHSGLATWDRTSSRRSTSSSTAATTAGSSGRVSTALIRSTRWTRRPTAPAPAAWASR